MNWHSLKQCSPIRFQPDFDNSEVEAFLELLLEQDSVSAIRSETIMNGPYHGPQCYNRNEEDNMELN